MSQNSDLGDALKVIRDLERRVRDLERANPLNFASVTGGTGIGIRSPLGVHIESGGSLAADQLRIDRAVGGSVRTPGNVEAGYLKSAGDVNADGTVRGYAGVMAPVDGSMQSLGPKVGAATSAAAAAQSRADSAYDLANGKPTKAYVDAGDAGKVAQGDFDTLSSQVGELKADVVAIYSPSFNIKNPLVTSVGTKTLGGTVKSLVIDTATGRLGYIS